MKTFIVKGLTLVFTLSLAILLSCDKDFEKINENPNAPGLDKAAPNLMLTNAIESVVDQVYDIWIGHEIGSCWAQHMAKCQYTDEDRYIPRPDVTNSRWSSSYRSGAMDLVTIKEIGRARLNNNYVGVALVLQAYQMSRVADIWGDAPFSEAWRAAPDKGGILSPKYDTQQSVYLSLIDSLDLANTLLDPDGPEIAGDILYNNDIMAWKKFANTLRFHYLLKISGRESVGTEMAAMLAAPATYPMFEGVSDAAALQYLGSAPNNNPLHENRKTRDDHRVSKTLTDLMWTETSYVDWRVTVYAQLSGLGDFNGIPNGLTSAKATAYLDNGIKNTSKMGSYFLQATAPGILMTYAEHMFDLAEAQFKGYITTTSTTEDLYKGGIWASYEQLGPAIEEMVLAYFDIDATWDVHAQDFYDNDEWQWDEAHGMECIATQRWVALFGQGVEAWTEYRRTNYPPLVAAEDGVIDIVPLRLPYPTDEQARNNENRQAAMDNQGMNGIQNDDMQVRLWWDVD
jgi:hypothetical protein